MREVTRAFLASKSSDVTFIPVTKQRNAKVVRANVCTPMTPRARTRLREARARLRYMRQWFRSVLQHKSQ